MRVAVTAHAMGLHALLLLAALGLAACGGAPPPADGRPGSAAHDAVAERSVGDPPSTIQPSTTPRRVMVTPTPVDRSCQVDADCAVKDVGNCCGAYPACVSIHSATDPAGVMAQCAQQGIAGTSCGVPVVTGCQCVDNVCGDIARDGEFLQ